MGGVRRTHLINVDFRHRLLVSVSVLFAEIDRPTTGCLLPIIVLFGLGIDFQSLFAIHFPNRSI